MKFLLKKQETNFPTGTKAPRLSTMQQNFVLNFSPKAHQLKVL